MNLDEYKNEIKKLESQDHLSKQDSMVLAYCKNMVKHDGEICR